MNILENRTKVLFKPSNGVIIEMTDYIGNITIIHAYLSYTWIIFAFSYVFTLIDNVHKLTLKYKEFEITSNEYSKKNKIQSHHSFVIACRIECKYTDIFVTLNFKRDIQSKKNIIRTRQKQIWLISIRWHRTVEHALQHKYHFRVGHLQRKGEGVGDDQRSVSQRCCCRCWWWLVLFFVGIRRGCWSWY